MNRPNFIRPLLYSLVLIAVLLIVRPTFGDGPSIAWGTVPSPNGGFDPSNRLNAVSVLSPTDIWAVGSVGFSINVQPQVQHWDGNSWSIVPIPAEVDEAELLGVAAIAADDVWLVGGYQNSGEALILHWNGAALTVADHPNPGLYNRFYAVTAISADDVWAVGEYASGGISQTLTQHWDGVGWQVVDSPTDPSSYTELRGVAGVSGSDVWAVGTAGNAPYTVHWDGSQWQEVTTPTVGTSVELKAVSAVASNDVWAVGDGSEGTLTLHWDGSQWTIIPSPTLSQFFNDLNSVAALAANDVWAAGYYSEAGSWKTFTIHWDGTAWSQVASPSPDPSHNVFYGIAAQPGSGQVWAVGRGGGTLVARWNNPSWEVVPSANTGTADNELVALDAIAADDIWAVGTAGDQPLTEHWNGSVWSIVASPTLVYDAELNDVAAVAGNDVWAVGTTGEPSWIDFDTVTMHWDGGQWTVIPSPNGNPDSYNELHAVAAVAGNDVWAVGEYWGDDSYSHPLILHWDGVSWSIMPHNCGSYNALIAITVIAPDDIWATGNALTCHYDGNTWTEIPSPQPRPAYYEVVYSLEAIDAVSADDIWIVGSRTLDYGQYLTTAPFAEHWDGTSWTPFYNFFPILGYGVTAIASDDVWAVGTGIAHWDGQEWEEVPSPNPGQGNQLNDVDALAADNLWAAGYYFDDDFGTRTLIEHAPADTAGTVRGNTAHSGSIVTWLGPASGSTTANAFGDYEAADLPAGTYTFIAAADSCTPDVETVEVIAGTTVFQDFVIDCSSPPPPGPMGMVSGNANHSNVMITWVGPAAGSIMTDEFGDYEAADLPVGTYTFVATADSCTPEEATVNVIADTMVYQDFEMDCSTPPPPPPAEPLYHLYLPIAARIE